MSGVDKSVDLDGDAGSPPNMSRLITVERFHELEAELRARGFGPEIDNAQTRTAPVDARLFALEVAYVIVNSGMKVSVAGPIYAAVEAALDAGASARNVFGHPGKAAAIDAVWRDREQLFVAFAAADDLPAWCQTLPFVGPITRYHLAKNLGGNYVKPDVHLARLAAAEGVTPWQLCHRLAQATGYREAAVDTVLWRACAARLPTFRAIC